MLAPKFAGIPLPAGVIDDPDRTALHHAQVPWQAREGQMRLPWKWAAAGTMSAASMLEF